MSVSGGHSLAQTGFHLARDWISWLGWSLFLNRACEAKVQSRRTNRPQVSKERTEYMSQKVSSAALLTPNCFLFLNQQGKSSVIFCICQYLCSESIMNHILVCIKYGDVAVSFPNISVYPLVLAN